MKPIEIFIGERGRLRSGWRLIVFLLALVLLLSFFGGILGAVLYYQPHAFAVDGSFAFFLQGVILLVASLAAGWLCGRFLEGLPFRALGASPTTDWLKDFGLGLAIGAASIGFAVLITVVFGGAIFDFNRTAGQSAILTTLGTSLGVFAFGAAAEEALFRGYVLQTFTRARLAWLAIVLTSLFFAAGHFSNPNANNVAMLNTVLAGIWFSVAYLRTKTLWLPFGLHLAWNWVQGAVFGIPVSGITSITAAPVFQPTNIGATFLSGGDYGIEGGYACTIAMIFSIALIWFLPIFKSDSASGNSERF